MANTLETNGLGREASQGRATIGTSITIKGEISGSEDLLIQGTVEGSVTLNEHVVTIGETAHVRANVIAREIRVEGEITGDLTSKERVMVRASGKVKGNIISPCLSLEEGARIKGSIDTDSSTDERVAVTMMESKQERKTKPAGSALKTDTEFSEPLDGRRAG